jgi:5-formyltetrahydrofolate cyclo-ligase
MIQDKKHYRRMFLQKRDLLPPQKRHELSRRITDNVSGLPEVAQAVSLMFYVSFGSEVQTHEMIRCCLNSGKTVAAPRVDTQSRRLVPCRVSSFEDDLTKGAMGILEPNPDRCPEVSKKDIDIVIVPGLAFSENGRRIGYGGGYYDRFLRGAALKTVAVAFEMQITDSLPFDSHHDVPVKCIVTEERILRC